MDWNRDGNIDAKDCVEFHEFIDKKPSNEHTVGGSSGRNFEITQKGWVFLGLFVLIFAGFIYLGSNLNILWNLIEIGFIVFIVAQWLDH